MNKADKIFEAKVQLKNREHYERLKAPMVKTRQEHIDDMTNYSFEDTLLQPIAQKQKSFVKGTTDFIIEKNFIIEKTKIGQDTILVSIDVSSLDTNILQEEGTEIVCKAYDSFHNYNPPIPTRFPKELLGLILNENSFQFNGENYL